MLAITTILFGLATLAIGDGGRGRVVEHEAKRLQRLCELAAQTAVLQGQEIGAVFTENTYGFFNHDTDQWRAFAGNDPLRRRSLPEGLRFHIAIEGSLLTLDAARAEVEDPQIIFFANGEIVPFEAHLTDTQSRRSFRLSANMTGALELSEASGPVS